MISTLILQGATRHAAERGFGYDSIHESNAAWVLSRLSIQMDEYPSYDGELTVETWVEGVERFFTQRCFRFINKDNQTIGYARSIWAAIDLVTRRPVNIPEWRPDLANYIAADKECPIEKLAKIPSVEGEEPSIGYTVRYSDIDINHHMNSVKYMEHIINVFPLSYFQDKFIHKFEIVYLAEGAFGDKLKLYKEKVSEDTTLIDTKKGEESICRSRITWK
jgi:acyl-ACP thioesterase